MEDKKEKFSTPGAIVVAGVIIALAIVFTNGSGERSTGNQPKAQPQANNAQQTVSLDNIIPITAEDHIRGNPNAPIKIVEYSDFECPFCKRFHLETMTQIMEEYGESGQVAWVYRHFPLDSLHPVKARLEATVSECVAEIGGNDAFWRFADAFFAVSPSNNKTEVETVIPQIIGQLGLSMDAIDECVTSGKYDQHIQDNIDNAIATGGQGTPWSIIVIQDGQMFPVNGAQPYSAVKSIIDIALK